MKWWSRFSVSLNLAFIGLLLTAFLQVGTWSQSFLGNEASTLVHEAIALAGVAPKPDTLLAQPWWQDEVQYRVALSRGQTYSNCLFGDSISSGLGNTLGAGSFNFALGGMSSVSLVEQMNQLVAANVRCDRVILAIGTNDADYRITNDQFVQNMRQAIGLARQMVAAQIFLLPAFYSTFAASQNIAMAGPIARVEEINGLLQQTAVNEQATLTSQGLDGLYNGQALRSDLTTDGVHLNASGRVLYRNALLRLIAAPS